MKRDSKDTLTVSAGDPDRCVGCILLEQTAQRDRQTHRDSSSRPLVLSSTRPVVLSPSETRNSICPTPDNSSINSLQL